MNKQIEPGGVSRGHAPSIIQKLTFAGLHFFSLLVCFYIAFGDGVSLLNQPRAILLAFVAALYFCRHMVTLFYLLMRRIDWGEVLGLSVFFAAFEIGFVWLGGQMIASLGVFDVVGILLLAVGSYLNTFSEVQRKWWKADPKNKGKCYTIGLFRYSMHINFFGDLVLFSGWALLTASMWALGLPLMMTMMFIFLHIPPLDAYLADRYGPPFLAYAAKTKKLIPFIY